MSEGAEGTTHVVDEEINRREGDVKIGNRRVADAALLVGLSGGMVDFEPSKLRLAKAQSPSVITSTNQDGLGDTGSDCSKHLVVNELRS